METKVLPINKVPPSQPCLTAGGMRLSPLWWYRGLDLKFFFSLIGATSLKMLMKISQVSLKIIIKEEMAPSYFHA